MRCPPPAPGGASSLHSPQVHRPHTEQVQPPLEVGAAPGQCLLPSPRGERVPEGVALEWAPGSGPLGSRSAVQLGS